ncbi:hypothetical protein RRG08_058499 [Elysia crispata]|uniref:Uncharacterized protein n=1 Tax=Elysia crispata TaxID=231223 RepID=A0AAE1CTB9_9GAST|nr:hypothetical protein RRG08_058499 [Elysia crispata]
MEPKRVGGSIDTRSKQEEGSTQCPPGQSLNKQISRAEKRKLARVVCDSNFPSGRRIPCLLIEPDGGGWEKSPPSRWSGDRTVAPRTYRQNAEKLAH